MYTNGSNGNGNGNGNGHKRVKLTLRDLSGVDTLDAYPDTLGEREADAASPQAHLSNATAAEPNPEPTSNSPAQTKVEKPDDAISDDELEENLELIEQYEKRKRWKRLLLSFSIIACAVLVLFVAGYLWLFAGSGDESYRVRNTAARNRAGEGATNSNTSPQALTVEEIARELNGGNVNSSTARGQTVPPATANQNGATVNGGGSLVTDRLPLGDYSTTVTPNVAPQQSQGTPAQSTSTTGTGNQTSDMGNSVTGATGGANTARATPSVGSPNPERSIRVSAPNNAARDGGRESVSPENLPRTVSASSNGRTEQVSLPPLGTMLPVRTLGTIYTLRSDGYVRMQLTREASGRGWSLARGTELYGVVRGSDFEIGRAQVQLVGFIDQSTGSLVRLQGNVLGSDGADGLRGRKRSLQSGWGRALRIAGAGVAEALSTVAATVGRRPVYVGDVYGYGAPRVTSPLMQELNGIAYRQGRGGFVEVPAGSAGYVLVMTSPREIQGVDADANKPVEDLRRSSDANTQRAATQLSEAELAELMTGGNREDIRRALPRMTPEMRRVAEAVLAGQ